MNTREQPSYDPANLNSMSGMLVEVLTKFLQGVDDMLPAQVISYSRVLNRAVVQPLIVIVTTGGQQIQRGQIVNIPVQRIGGGGAVLSFNMVPGDLGWIKANDRDISLLKSGNYKPVAPNTKRKHNFSDAVFLPDVMKNFTLASEDAANAVLQTINGAVRIALFPTQLKLTAPGVGINGDADANAILDLHSTTKAFLPPRMTTTQRNAIPSPQEGMVVYNLTTHGLSVYNGTTWS